MLKAQLGNEFGKPASSEYKRRQEAFDKYNNVTGQAPDRAAQIIASLAIGEDVQYGDKTDKDIYHAAMHVLDVTNNGTQIGVTQATREAAWAEVFKDDGHKEAVLDYNRFPISDHQTPEAIDACRKRGLHTLKVIALTHLPDEARAYILAAPQTNILEQNIAA